MIKPTTLFRILHLWKIYIETFLLYNVSNDISNFIDKIQNKQVIFLKKENVIIKNALFKITA